MPADRFADFVSRRSPVFKERPLPSSKSEAIDLMLEQPNLIKRPILIKGSRVVFGFDKDEYRRLFGTRPASRIGLWRHPVTWPRARVSDAEPDTVAMSAILHRHVRLELPGRARVPGTGSSTRHAGTRGFRRGDELAYYAGALRHRRGELLLLPAASRRPLPAGGSRQTPAGFRVLGQAVPGVHPPDDARARRTAAAAGVSPVPSSDPGRRGRVPGRPRPDRRGRQARHAARRSSRRLPPTPETREYLAALLATFGTTRLPSSSATESWSDDGDADRRAAERSAAPPGCRSTSRSSGSRSGRTRARRHRVLLPAAARPQRRAVVGPRLARRPVQLPLLARRAETVRRGGARERGRRPRRHTST